MTSEAVSPLRRRMIEDMTIRQFGGKTKSDYIRQVHEFAVFLGRSPDRAEPEDLRRYQLHMVSLGASYARMNLAATALRFFFHTTLGRTGFGDRMARIPSPERLPGVRSPEEVAFLLAHASSLKYRAALSVAYGCGLRVSEIANLKVGDIDSSRMLIRVEQGKGRKDRFVMLSPDLLDLLRQWWRGKRPRGWLFPGQQPPTPTSQPPPRLPGRRRSGQARQARLDAHPAAQLRHPPPGAQDRHPRHPGAARASQARHHRHLYAGGTQGDPRGHKSARAAGTPATAVGDRAPMGVPHREGAGRLDRQ